MDKELSLQTLEKKLIESERKVAVIQKKNKELNSENERLKNEIHSYRELILSSPSMITLLKGKELLIQTANKPILDFWEKSEKVIGKPLIEVHPDIREQGLESLLHGVLDTGEPQYGYEMPVYITRKDKKELVYFNFIYQPQKNRHNQIDSVAVIAQEVTPKAKYHEKIKESEFKFRQLIHSSNSLIAILRGKDMIVEIANDAIKSVWGKGSEIEGEPLFEILPEMIGQGMPEIFNKVYETGEAYVAQERPIMHDHKGKMKLGYFDFVYQPQHNIHGKVDGVAVIAQDVTQHGILNKKIRESEKEFRDLVNFMPHKISMISATGEPIFYNNSWVSYTGKSFEKLVENPWQSLIHPDDRQLAEELVAKSLESGEDMDVELRIFNKDGKAKWHLARATAIRNEEGVISSWIASNTEIHKLKEEEKRKEDFLKLVSHELKTPVTSIKGYIQLLLSMLPSEEKEERDNEKIPVKPYLNKIEIQIERLIRLISEMLDLSRIEQKELQLKKESFSLNEHVENIIEDISYSNKEVQIELEHKNQCEVYADKDRIGQVIINFVTNAFKYSPNGNKVIIKVFERKDDHVGVSIKDFGIGIAKKEQNKIFKRFYRIAGNKDYTYAGFGIGLYLSNEIIKRHSGEIIVHSEVGEGSEFIFTLPINKD
ncbi:ATP-binding protein [Gramella sp. MAR_2010_147]|uniref:ATP-binding protein n=1 Tax=Gramella sp. MAR_2010_147 TaxID=1250205 RepID=UPI00087ACB8E|nr:ATP-binding protein [Gramella sp. MAR_2010_147]SDR78371.1 hypothetical protein SAMN04488553_0663 [Gramella sp. MAR_2010_147]